MLLPLPTPSSVPLSSLLLDRPGSHGPSLSEASNSRAALRSALKGAAESQDWEGCMRATADYVPLLLGVLACLDADELIPQREAACAWSTPLTSQSIASLRTKSAQRTVLPGSFRADLIVTLHAHALALSNRSATLIASLGSYETVSSTSTAALKQLDEQVNAAADMLCRAAGVWELLARQEVARWENEVGAERKAKRPVELSAEVFAALASIALADANSLAIRRLLSRAVSYAQTTFSPGPPLPSSHPSPSLLAKLHLHVHALYASAGVALRPSNLSAARAGQGEIKSELRAYVDAGTKLGKAMGYKFLGIDAGENGRSGEAVAWLELARKELDGIDSPSGSGSGGAGGGAKWKPSLGKNKGAERKGKLEWERESIEAFKRSYKAVNDTVHFQPVPASSSLLPLTPAGRAALQVKAYTLPPAAFSPTLSSAGGEARIEKELQKLELSSSSEGGAGETAEDDSDDEDEGARQGAASKPPVVGNYFGAGNYW